jgi:hypothetical protein
MHPVQIKLWVLVLQDELSAPDQREAEIMNLVIIFVLVLLDAGQNRTGDEYFFLRLNSCLDVREKLIYQSTSKHAWVRGKSKHFNSFCEVRQVDEEDARANYLFWDDPSRNSLIRYATSTLLAMPHPMPGGIFDQAHLTEEHALLNKGQAGRACNARSPLRRATSRGD